MTACPECGAPLRYAPEMGRWCPDCLWSPE